ncbi:MAG: hypothetical protein JWQ47_2282 [Glaciihabitans sp.]|nr:hypothetical protein [Glaciihabitans sp.]
MSARSSAPRQSLAQAVARVVAAAPPLTEAQVAFLSAAFAGVTPVVTVGRVLRGAERDEAA